MHITKTIVSGDGSVRREMRFRTQSDSRVSARSRPGAERTQHRWLSYCDVGLSQNCVFHRRTKAIF